MELDVMCRKKRDGHAADIACAIQIPEMKIHDYFEGYTETERNAVNLSDHSKVNITCQRLMEVWEWRLAM
jgi:hypothetical protein